ncbi:hypothetical protein IJ843_06425 [bacterium]|nr:hypothetical protein [bacterium]
MTNKPLKRNIAAVSLIEIIMIFTIIGIVTTACISLAKPKYEYMTKIKLYAALSALESAAKIITSEGHLDFTTDLNTCSNRVGNICQDYNGQYPNLNNQLPKVAFRDTLGISGTTVTDSGINGTAYGSISGTNAAIRKENFKYLQSGLCQRLAKVMNVTSTSINCQPALNSTNLIDDSANYRQSFWGVRQDLTLPNGQVLYISKNLYNDFDYAGTGNNLNKHIVTSDPVTANYNHYISNGEDIFAQNANTSNLINNWGISTSYCLNSSSHCSSYLNMPNETRVASLKILKKVCQETNQCSTFYNTENAKSFYNYLEHAYSKNKDYFQIYVDTNCKMTTATDKQCGPDRLNQDVFAFRMYRDGTVIPDYRSGFPRTALVGKILTKIPGSGNAYGQYRYTLNAAYAMQPIVYSRCYANQMGSFYATYSNDHMGICTYGGAHPALNDCKTETSDSLCKTVINKPSFVMR